eukprot:scaffold2755_cov194-Ochromonas_danica.AAC.3
MSSQAQLHAVQLLVEFSSSSVEQVQQCSASSGCSFSNTHQWHTKLSISTFLSRPAVQILNKVGVAEWPSGPRRSTQVRISTEAWVRTPLQSTLFASEQRVSSLELVGDVDPPPFGFTVDLDDFCLTLCNPSVIVIFVDVRIKSNHY